MSECLKVELKTLSDVRSVAVSDDEQVTVNMNYTVLVVFVSLCSFGKSNKI